MLCNLHNDRYLHSMVSNGSKYKAHKSFLFKWWFLAWYIRRNGKTLLNFFLSNWTFPYENNFLVALFQDRSNAYADTLSESTEELLRLLLLIDYSKGYFFTSLNDRAASAVREAIRRKNVELNSDDTNLLYYLPKETALEFDVQWVVDHMLEKTIVFWRTKIMIFHSRPPVGIELKPVTKFSDFQKAFLAWPGGKWIDKSFIVSLLKW